MSLRWRISLALTALALAVTLAFGILAYQTTSARANQTLDARVTEAATELAKAGAAPSPASDGGDPMPSPATAQGCSRLQLDRCPELSLMVAQRLDRTGRVTVSAGGVALPVTVADRAIARHGGRSWLHTVSIGNQQYRMLTMHVGGGGAVEVAENMTLTARSLTALRWKLLAGGVLLVLAALIAGAVMAKRLTRPLDQLTEFTNQARGGKSRMPESLPSRHDEVGRLARSFVELLGELRSSREQQRQLVHDAGHELRTPLTSLRTNIELLNKHGDALAAPVRQQLVASLDAESLELTHLVEEVLELAGDDFDEQEVAAVRVDEVVARVIERVRLRTSREVRLVVVPWTAVVQERALARAVGNLLSNAAKFSPAEAPIDVVTLPGRVVVRDRGPGIAKADMPKIFSRFYRSPSAQSTPGSGLGLAIVKRFAESNGGHVLASNATRGALVGFMLPVANIEHDDPVDEVGGGSPPVVAGAPGREELGMALQRTPG